MKKGRHFLVVVFLLPWAFIMTLRHSGTAHAMLLLPMALAPNHHRHFNQLQLQEHHQEQSPNGDAAQLSRQIESSIRDGNYLEESAVSLASSSLFNSSPVSSATMAALSSSSTDFVLKLQQHLPTTPDTPTAAAFEQLLFNSTSMISSTFSSSSTPYNYVTTLPSQIGMIYFQCFTMFSI